MFFHSFSGSRALLAPCLSWVSSGAAFVTLCCCLCLLWGFAPQQHIDAQPTATPSLLFHALQPEPEERLLARASRRGGESGSSSSRPASSNASSKRKSSGDGDKGLYIDQSEKSLSRMPSSKKRMLTSEKSYKMQKGKMADTIDFDETDITGQRRDPGVGFVKSTSKGDSMNFVKIRRKWHDSMVKSTLLVD